MAKIKRHLFLIIAFLFLQQMIVYADNYYHVITTDYGSYELGSTFTATISVSTDASTPKNIVLIDSSMGSDINSRQGFNPAVFDSVTATGNSYSWQTKTYSSMPNVNTPAVKLTKGVVEYGVAWSGNNNENVEGIPNVGASPKTIYSLSMHVKQDGPTGYTLLELDSFLNGGRYWFNTNTSVSYTSNLILGNKSLLIVASAPPTGFAGVQSATNTDIGNTVIISWNALPNDRTSDMTPPIKYNVYCGTSPNFVPSSANRIAQSVTGNSYTHGPNTGVPGSGLQKLVDGTTYYYKVRAHDSCTPLYNEDTNVIEISAVPRDQTPPSNPSGAGSLSGDQTLNISWTNPPQPDFDKVLIVRRVGSSVTFTPTKGTTYTVGQDLGGGQVVVYNGNGNSLVETGLNNGTKYYYKLFAYDVNNADQEGLNYSSGVEILGIPGIPPSTVTLETIPKDEKLLIKWVNAPEPYFAGVMIRRSTIEYPATPNAGELVVDKPGLPSSSESYLDTGLINGVTYYYSAFAYNAVLNYAAPGKAVGTPELDVVPPHPVTWLYGLPNNKDINLTWINPNDEDFDGVVLIRGENAIPTYQPSTGETFTVGQNLGGTQYVAYVGPSQECVDKDLAFGNKYYYKAFAYDIPRKNYATPELTAVSLVASGGGGAGSIESITFTNSTRDPVTSYKIGEDGVYVMVKSDASNTSSTVAEDITVEVKSILTGDIEKLMLTETGANTGIFVNATALPLVYAVTTFEPYNGTIEAVYNEILEAKLTAAIAQVRTAPAPVVSPTTGLARTAVSYPDPNNPNNYLIRYTLAQDADVVLIIYNTNGEIVWKRDFYSGQNGGWSSAENVIRWDITDDYGRNLENGVYFYKVFAKRGSSVLAKGKILILR